MFHTLPRISDTAVADLLQVIRTRMMRFLVRRRVVEADTDADTMLLPDDLAERDPALAQLATAAVSGLPPQHCGGRMRLVALVQDQQSIDRFLRDIGQSTDFPPLAPARGPPYFTVQASRSAKNVTPVAPEPIDESA